MYRALLTIGVLAGIATPLLAAVPDTPLAYIALSDGYWQAWVMQPDGSHARQVTRSAYDKSRLSWYPDGTHLLVNGGQGELNRVEVESGREVPVTLPLTGITDAVLSPDGKRIAFSVGTADSRDGNDIWVVNADGVNLSRVARLQWLQHDPAWTQDGTTVYFLSASGKLARDIWKADLAQGKVEPLTNSTTYLFDIALSAQGELAYSGNQTGNYEIWVQQEGRQPRQLTDHPAYDGKPSWSPDGRQLVFESTRGGMPELWLARLEGGQPVQLTHHEQGAHSPVWFTGEAVTQ